MSWRGRRSLAASLADTRGVVMIEHLIVLFPVVLLAVSTWQLIELWQGDLILRHAAVAAVRAAIVVLPDNPTFYAETAVDQFTGARKTEIERAASLVLATSRHFEIKPLVELSRASGHEPLTATVSAPFRCDAGWLSLVCRGQYRLLTATATLPYQGARYRF